jgi:hypothetical protein
MTTPMNAIGMNPTLLVSASAKPASIEPEGIGRSHSATPWRMLSVAIVAMMEDSPNTFVRITLKSPNPRPQAMTARQPPISSYHVEPIGIVYEAITQPIVICAPTETSKTRTMSAFV